jgi:hypothetical protein
LLNEALPSGDCINWVPGELVIMMKMIDGYFAQCLARPGSEDTCYWSTPGAALRPKQILDEQDAARKREYDARVLAERQRPPVPGRRPWSDGAQFLACRSIELFDQLAPKFTRDGKDIIVGPLLRDCQVFTDSQWVAENNIFHVQKIKSNYICVLQQGESDCYWTRADAVVDIGHVQLSDEQFAELSRLTGRELDLREKALDYSTQASKVREEAGIAADPVTRKRLLTEAERLKVLEDDYSRQADDLDKQAKNIRPTSNALAPGSK